MMLDMRINVILSGLYHVRMTVKHSVVSAGGGLCWGDQRGSSADHEADSDGYCS